MPTYDYRCKACGHELELFQSMSAAPKKKCPACGKSTLERLIGAGAGFLFKGQGFYLTDYRSKRYTEAAKKESGAGSASTDKPSTEKASETKPAASNGAPSAEKSAAKSEKKKESSGSAD